MTISIPTSTLERFTTFGDLLRYLRRLAGITQAELSMAVGYSDAQISRLEKNLRLPDISTIEARFVRALGLEQEPNAVRRMLELAVYVNPKDVPCDGFDLTKGLNFFSVSEIVEREVQHELKAVLAEVEKQRVDDQSRFDGQLRHLTFYFAGATMIGIIMAFAVLYFGCVL